jgi:hypothetical protein
MANPGHSSFFYMLKRIQIWQVILLLLAVTNFSCDSDDPASAENPSNLVVEITRSEEEPGKIKIEASADNTVTYALYIGAASEPETENSSGLFEYEFLQSGNYTVEVRAYGLSGMYIKETRQVMIDISDGVSVDDGYFSSQTYEGYDLVWNDEFNGSEVDPVNWVFETGTGCPGLCGWGNNELQFYRQENAWLEDGTLTIEARNEN